MKIICVDNYARETVADRLVADNIKSEEYAKCMCKALCDKYSSEYSTEWFQVVDDNYRLSRGMEDLV